MNFDMHLVIFSWLIRMNSGFERFGGFGDLPLMGVTIGARILVEACL